MIIIKNHKNYVVAEEKQIRNEEGGGKHCIKTKEFNSEEREGWKAPYYRNQKKDKFFTLWGVELKFVKCRSVFDCSSLD